MNENHLTEIIANEPLALDVQTSVEAGVGQPHIHLAGSTVKDVVQNALDAAIQDISEHPKGKLFQRFIEHGPHDARHETEFTSELETELTDSECGTCIEFIHSHMVNRFKGELAELLAIEPCVSLIKQLHGVERLSDDTDLFWGDTIQERRRVKGEWAEFAKGADGLVVRVVDAVDESGEPTLELHGVIEVKSMHRSKRRLDAQLKSHVIRLGGGVKLGADEWQQESIVDRIGVRISVLPANWKLDRRFKFEETETGRRMVFPERSGPHVPTTTAELSKNRWKITLGWSQEALEEAAYEMTFWYMAQVGRHVFSKTELPRSWDDMTTEDAGRNSIKMMLYHAILRPLSDRHARLAAKLYNVYCFGYPVGIDSREMLWPEDLE